ncbi:MAG TPA: YggS family pyridoxal phosphate-dependent enzyme [Gammaproteobacteria bacterium]|nr:YggS family pyridoxal phosphate-dependent enzyme [Gammaproteobacteria bacterium]
MQTLDAQFRLLLDRIASAEQRFERPSGSVRLLAVSKTRPSGDIEQVYRLGQRDFGENYLQEALPKIQALAGLSGVQWHFIGRIQANKTGDIAAAFDWVHSVDRLKIAQRLNEQRPTDRPPLNICLQVNLEDEISKGGIAPAEATLLAAAIAELPRLKLRGLMCIPAEHEDFDTQRRVFARLRRLRDELNRQGQTLDTLSMGMSGDLEAAIAEGSTLVRVGTAIFGHRS